MSYFSTGIDTVDKMGKLNYTGNVKPLSWHKTIVNEKGKPQRLAMDILADICYWYKPTEIRDETSGQVIGWKKRFAADMLQRSYSDLMDFYCEEKKTVIRAVVFLEELGVIKRVFRKLKYKNGMTANNVMFIDLNYERLYELTFPEEDEKTDKDNGNSTGEFEVLEEHLSSENQLKKEENVEKTEMSIGDYKYDQTSVQICREGATKMSVPMDGSVERLCTPLSVSPDRDVHTNTYNTTQTTSENTPINTTEITTGDTTSVSNHIELLKKRHDADVDIDAITAMVNELIIYDLLHTDFDNPEVEYDATKDEFNGILEEVRDVLVYEVFAAPDDKRFNFGKKDDPDFKSNAIVKNVFYKHLGYGTVKSYITQYLNNSTPVRRATMYHIKSLYHQCLTQSSQYMSGGRSFFARES